MPACWPALNVLITAGPTRERLDPVRYLTNRSSGKMGFAVAAAAREAGAHVTLVAGPVQLPTPAGITRINVESARDMYAAVHRHVAEADIFIAAAAVADFQPVTVAKQKIKKQGGTVKLDLEAAPDIIKSVADMAKRPFVVGFAAETNDVEENARSKLKRKKLDMIAANQVGDGMAFDCEDNALTVLWPGGQGRGRSGAEDRSRARTHRTDRRTLAAVRRRPAARSAQTPRRHRPQRRRAAKSPAQPPHPPLIRCNARSSCGSWTRASGANSPCPRTPRRALPAWICAPASPLRSLSRRAARS